MILVVSETEPGGSKHSNDHADAASLMAIMASEINTLQVWHKLSFFCKIRRYDCYQKLKHIQDVFDSDRNQKGLSSRQRMVIDAQCWNSLESVICFLLVTHKF